MKKHYSLLFLLLLFVCVQTSAQEYKKMIEKGTFKVQEIQEKAEDYFNIVGRERGKGYKPYKRWEYRALRNADENGYLKSSDFYYTELERYNTEINNTVESSRRTTVGNWETLGPTYKNGTSGWNPGVGRLTSVAIELTNVNHIIVGSPSGIWKTLDAGVNWSVLTDNLSNLDVSALTINPTDNTNYFWGSNSGIIYNSTDSGATWNILATIPGFSTVNKILIDHVNPNKMYASLSGAGTFKSTDFGVTWSKINALSNSGYDIEFKPGDTNTIYASGSSFFKSTDGGVTFTSNDPILSFDQEFISSNVSWETSSANINNSVTPRTGDGLGLFYSGNFNDDSTQLIISNLNLSAVTNPQLNFSYTSVNWDGDVDELIIKYKTSLTGAWQTLQTYTAEQTNWQNITLALPNSSTTYYVAFQAISQWGRGLTLDDVSVTANGGSATLFSSGFESTAVYDNGPKLMAVTADNPDVIYMLEAENGLFGNLYKSTDGGNNFITLDHTGKNYFGYSSLADDDRGQAPRDMAIAVNPNNENEVHIAGILSWRSMNGGVNFNITSQWIPDTAASQNIGYCHADIDLMEYINGKLYLGTDGGIFVADNPQIVNSNYYRDLTAGLGIRQFYRIGVNQSNTEVITGGSQDNGTSVYDNTGTWKDWLGADGMESFIDKDNNDILYGTVQFGSLYKSTNQGNTRFNLSEPDGKSGNWVTPFEQDPTLQNTIYSGYDQVYKSINGGSTWTAISQIFIPAVGPAFRPNNLNELKIAPSNNSVMYASIGDDLYKTTNGGATNWTSLSGFTGSINSIAIHPTNENKIAIATRGNQKVYVSNDGGATWISYLNNLPNFTAFALVWQNNADNGLYVGMNYGVYYIDDTFTDWQYFSNNLPNVEISELEINTVNGKLYASTFGRGLWKSSIYDSSILSVSEENYFSGLLVSPNPASDFINLNWSNTEKVTLKIYNTLGKVILHEKELNISNNYSVDVSSYNSGIYFVSINNSKAQITKKIIIN